jgi:hypothetical protein
LSSGGTWKGFYSSLDKVPISLWLSDMWLTVVEAEVAHLAANYLKWLSIGIPGYGGTVLIKKYVISPFLVKRADTIDTFKLRD